MTTEPYVPPTLIKHEHIENVYMAGPMSRIAQYNYPAFFIASEVFTLAGYTVRNPADNGLDTTDMPLGTEKVEGYDVRAAFADYTHYITTTADAVAVLPGWETSPGARGEVALALAIGLPILDALTGELLDVTVTVTAQPKAVTERAASIGRHPAGNAAARTGAPLLSVAQTIEKFDERDTVDETRTEAPLPFEAPVLRIAATPRERGEVKAVSVTGGEKALKEARLDLVPAGPLWELAVLYGRGQLKYPDPVQGAPNWKRGYPWSSGFSAMKRHGDLFWMGEDHDPEMAVKHLIAVAWHALNIAWFMENRPEFDDRPTSVNPERYEGALPTPQWLLDKVAERMDAEPAKA